MTHNPPAVVRRTLSAQRSRWHVWSSRGSSISPSSATSSSRISDNRSAKGAPFAWRASRSASHRSLPTALGVPGIGRETSPEVQAVDGGDDPPDLCGVDVRVAFAGGRPTRRRAPARRPARRTRLRHRLGGRPAPGCPLRVRPPGSPRAHAPRPPGWVRTAPSPRTSRAMSTAATPGRPRRAPPVPRASRRLPGRSARRSRRRLRPRASWEHRRPGGRGGWPLMTGANDERGDRGSWWRSGVLYQLYPRSFADSNGDGHGDLRASSSTWITWPGSASTASG